MPSFIHLRTYSSYSLLAGTIHIEDLIAKCVKDKIPAVGISDIGNLFGALEFSMQATKAGIQPIIGCVFKFDPQLDTQTNESTLDDILIIAKNRAGYQNLLKLASEYYEAKLNHYISYDNLASRSEGLIVLTCAPSGTVGRLLLNNESQLAEKFLLKLAAQFKDHLYIELMRHGLTEEEKIERQLIDLGLKHNIPFVATNNVYFLNKDMHEAHDALVCIANNRYLAEQDRPTSNPEWYFKSYEEMCELFADIPEAITNTVVIAKRCSVKAEPRPIAFPKYEISIGKDEEEELCILATQGLKERLETSSITDAQQYYDRLNYELGIINKMKFSGYFLIVSDFIRWAKSQNIPVGPGRGSGAGSVVSWSLSITDVDPIKFRLLFERFLNPERISLPDLDIDFCQDRRDEVISYVRNKYGKKRVAHIITFGTLQAKAVLRDVGRVMQVPYSMVDRIAKMIPFNAVNPVTLEQAIEMEPELKKAKQQDPIVAKLLNMSLQLEGLHRHASTHAAGVVIGDKDLDELVPFYQESKSGMPVIQYAMKYAEAAGLIKFDFLGLKTLTVIANCEALLKQNDPTFNIQKIPLEDPKVFEMLSKGQGTGVFQFESLGMRVAMSKMKPDTIEDIVALGALYRPGPMDNIPRYVDCKHGKIKPDYLHPKLEEVLKPTFGVIIYQEQVIEIARILAGYTLGAADLLRRAMGKKIKEEMDDQREIFVQGAIKNGLAKDQAISIFDLVAKFAGYGFNRSHAVAYGLISYQTAYLKVHYPAEMIASLLNTEILDTDKINTFIDEAKHLGLVVAAPDINTSREYFSVLLSPSSRGFLSVAALAAKSKEAVAIHPSSQVASQHGLLRACFASPRNDGSRIILYGLCAIKNVSFDSMKSVCEERDKNGPYKDIFDFMSRVGEQINKRQLEYLIKSGAFDSIANNRKQLFDGLEMLIAYHGSAKVSSGNQQLSLFDVEVYKPELALTSDWSKTEKLNNECSALGFYLTSHPLDAYQDYFKLIKVMGAAQIREELAEGVCNVKIAAIPVVIKNRSSPRGRYVFSSMSTSTGMLDITIFDDNILEQNRDSIYAKEPLLIEAEVKRSGDLERITATRIHRLDEYLSQQKSKVVIRVGDAETLKALKELIVAKSNAQSAQLITLRLAVDKKEVIVELPLQYRLNVMHESFTTLPNGAVLVEA